jgi:hypothetical protein
MMQTLLHRISCSRALVRSCHAVNSCSLTSQSVDLLLFNSFTRQTDPVIISGRKVRLNESSTRHKATAYVCGPTVYDESHLGHAITYVRFDLFRRALKAYASTDLGKQRVMI